MFEDWKPAELIALVAVVVTGVGMYVNRKTTLASIDKQTKTQLEVAELQHREASVANKRQDWINQLRSLLARFLATAPLIRNKAKRDEGYGTFLAVYSEFQLMLNPLEKDHQILLEALEKYFRSVDAPEPMLTDQSLEMPRRDLLVARAQVVLKREWLLVKTGRVDEAALKGLYENAEKYATVVDRLESDLRKRERR